jgi:hypothetical protein
MSKRSFEAINYALRPNKNVERKLIVSTLQAMRSEIAISEYKYVGFGSMWFADFVLVHKFLGIDSMVTIENQRSRERRVEFYKPFACIKVCMDEASNALGDQLGDRKSIVWLDYDGPLHSALTGDLEVAVGSMLPGSLILVTVNATVEQLKGKVLDGVDVAPEKYLAHICEDDSMLRESARLTRVDFPGLAAEIINNRLKSAVLERKPGAVYEPIWSYQYADQAEMITVGGMVADNLSAEGLRRSGALDLHHVTGSELFPIALPVLTEKEKRAIDKLLPASRQLRPSDLDFELRPGEISSYQRFYLEYPIFNEALV